MMFGNNLRILVLLDIQLVRSKTVIIKIMEIIHLLAIKVTVLTCLD